MNDAFSSRETPGPSLGALEKLGRAASEVGEQLIDPSELGAARKRLLGTMRPPRADRFGPMSRALAACAVVATVTFAGWRVRVARSHAEVAPLSFVVGAPPVGGAVGAWVAADASTEVPLSFSEGSRFKLAPRANLRVTETTDAGATLLLERGDVDAEVVHTSRSTRWTLHAGPFEVRVTGTRFHASWDPPGETFELAMGEGTVVVHGPLLAGGRELIAGERMRVSVRDGSLEVRSRGTPGTPTGLPTAAAGPPATQNAPVPTASAAVAADVPSVPTPSVAREEVTWARLAAEGRYADALAAAEQAGFEREIERAGARDLAALADAARYAGRPALAQKAILAQRRRFGARGGSAFLLGKIAADQQGAAAEAVRWFEVYLTEEPRGAFAEQALGRLLQLQRGDAAAGRRNAERYLALYPNGAQAGLARSLTSRAP